MPRAKYLPSFTHPPPPCLSLSIPGPCPTQPVPAEPPTSALPGPWPHRPVLPPGIVGFRSLCIWREPCRLVFWPSLPWFPKRQKCSEPSPRFCPQSPSLIPSRLRLPRYQWAHATLPTLLALPAPPCPPLPAGPIPTLFPLRDPCRSSPRIRPKADFRHHSALDLTDVGQLCSRKIRLSPYRCSENLTLLCLPTQAAPGPLTYHSRSAVVSLLYPKGPTPPRHPGLFSSLCLVPPAKVHTGCPV